jgi:ribosomal protein L37E
MADRRWWQFWKRGAALGNRVPFHLRDQIKYIVSVGDRGHLQTLINLCRGYDDGLSVLREARRECPKRWHALLRDLDEAIKGWGQPQVRAPSATIAATVETSQQRVPSELRNQIISFASDIYGGDPARFRELIERCRAYEDGDKVLAEARKVCRRYLEKDLDEAIKAWQPPRAPASAARMEAVLAATVGVTTGGKSDKTVPATGRDQPQKMPPFVDSALGPHRVGPLHEAIRKGDDRSFRLITGWVKSGGDIEWKDPNGWTLLHLAARFGNDKMARWLVVNGADISARSERIETPLIMACDLRNWSPVLNPAVVNILLENGADPNAENCDGDTALSCIFVYDNNPAVPQIVKLLLNRGAHQVPGKSVVCSECGAPASLKMRERSVEATLNGIFAQFDCPKCREGQKIPLQSIGKSTGVRVRDPSCGAISFIPPTVWCQTCGGGLSTGWQKQIKLG